jgi:hypothetical protein
MVGDVKQSLAAEAPTEMCVPYRQANQVLPVFGLSLRWLRTGNDPRASRNNASFPLQL